MALLNATWRTNVRGLLTFCFVPLMAVAACGSSTASSPTAASGPIVIGLAIARTGGFADFDNPVAAGVELAVSDQNAKGGINGRLLKTVYADTQSDPNQIQSAALKVLDEGAQVVITSCDYDLGGPAARAANQRNVVALGCASSPNYGVAGIGPLTFNTSGGTPTESAIMAQFAVKKGYKSVYVMVDQSLDYTRSTCDYFKKSFTKDGGTVAGTDTFQNTDTSFAAQVTRLKGATGADSIALCSYPPGGATLIRQLRGSGVDLPIIASDSFDGDSWLAAVPNASGIFHTSPGSLYGDDPTSGINDFIRRATGANKNQTLLSAYGLYGYATVQTIVKGIMVAGTTTGPALAKGIETLSNQPLILGPTTYTSKCHTPVGRPLRIMDIENGKTSFVSVITPSYVPPAPC